MRCTLLLKTNWWFNRISKNNNNNNNNIYLKSSIQTSSIETAIECVKDIILFHSSYIPVTDKFRFHRTVDLPYIMFKTGISNKFLNDNLTFNKTFNYQGKPHPIHPDGVQITLLHPVHEFLVNCISEFYTDIELHCLSCLIKSMNRLPMTNLNAFNLAKVSKDIVWWKLGTIYIFIYTTFI